MQGGKPQRRPHLVKRLDGGCAAVSKAWVVFFLNAEIFEQIIPGGAIFQEFKCRGITLSHKKMTGRTPSGLVGVRLNQISWQESEMDFITPIDEPETEYIIEGILKGSSF